MLSNLKGMTGTLPLPLKIQATSCSRRVRKKQVGSALPSLPLIDICLLKPNRGTGLCYKVSASGRGDSVKLF